ncbi:hypothetical protein HDU76_006142 [Blyttiomyces sp. JEL0837]|nr:hypothetical protein HDU76_006142 [Blyttiomyces sp. JEL0837]
MMPNDQKSPNTPNTNALTTADIVESRILDWFKDYCKNDPSAGIIPPDHGHIRQDNDDLDTPATVIRPIIVGISGPQGCGKTTLTLKLMESLTTRHNLRVCSLSIDDLYLTASDQTLLAQKNPGNKLLELRGNPGTHDIALGSQFFKSLIDAQANIVQPLNGTLPVTPDLDHRQHVIRIPSYDKSLNHGRGDRVPDETAWPTATLPIDIILFEGWCLGFRSLTNDQVKSRLVASSSLQPSDELLNHPVEHLCSIQDGLREIEKQGWYDMIDAFVHIAAEDIGFVYDWRVQQEEDMRKRFNDPTKGLTVEQVKDFVARFMPEYLLGLPTVDLKDWKRAVRIVLDRERRVKSVEG